MTNYLVILKGNSKDNPMELQKCVSSIRNSLHVPLVVAHYWSSMGWSKPTSKQTHKLTSKRAHKLQDAQAEKMTN